MEVGQSIDAIIALIVGDDPQRLVDNVHEGKN
jgi:hypothetical protein